THNLRLSSLFFTNNVGQPQDEALGQIKPLSSSSCNWIFSSANSLGGIRYGLFKIGAVPGCSSMTNSISWSGGIPGKSSGKTSAYSRTTGISSNLMSFMANAQEFMHSRNGK